MENLNITWIIKFWLADSCASPSDAFNRKDFWYRGGNTVDEDIKTQFGSLVSQAYEGKLTNWSQTPNGSLALIILLDQFTRNLFRSTPQAYIGDNLALKIVKQSIADGQDSYLNPVSSIWFYHPFHHSEELKEQDTGLELLDSLKKRSPAKWHAYIEKSIVGWANHRSIISRYDRFPHRNYVLGREDTSEELLFLKTSGQSFGQGPERVQD